MTPAAAVRAADRSGVARRQGAGARPRGADDRGRRRTAARTACSDGGRLTLEQKLESVWEGLFAGGAAAKAAACPVCASDAGWTRAEDRGATFTCNDCGSTLS